MIGYETRKKNQGKRIKEKEINYFFEFLKIQNHFFKELTSKLKKVKDHRSQSYITYGTEIILFTLLMKNVAGLKSMRSMSDGSNKEHSCLKDFRGLEQKEPSWYDAGCQIVDEMTPNLLTKEDSIWILNKIRK
ncbi:hypothetical protein ACF5W4_15250 [Bacillota bacterium Lsc_1132]